MGTVRELLAAGAFLPGDDGRRDAEVLLCHCLDKPRAWLYTWPDSEIAGDALQRYERLLARRLRGEPVAYLTGEREFWSLCLAVTPATLIPRPETETLVSRALALPLSPGAAVADLGTGSGAIALALASECPGWRVTGLDSSEEALAVAARNAAAHGLTAIEWLRSDWFGGLSGRRFDLLVSNPPYIDAADPHLDRGDLRYEPRGALVAPDTGLADLAAIVRDAPAHLHDGGWLLLEHGFEQGAAVRDMLQAAAFTRIDTWPDLAGLDRVTGGCLDAV